MSNKFSKKIPYVINDQFVLFDFKPINACEYSATCDMLNNQNTLILVLQGPIKYEHHFTLETVKLYQKNFPGCKVIVSTWENENADEIAKIKQAGAIVLLNKLPDFKGPSNTNYQIYSSYEGLKKAKELGAEYVIKTRTDQRIYETNVPEYLFNLLKLFPVDNDASLQKQRLVALSLNTFKYRLYDISDMFLFGHVDDVLTFWGCQHDMRTEIGIFRDQKEFAMQTPSEIYFTTEYIKKMGHEIKWTLEDSWSIYAKYFCIIDSNSIGLYWPKYSNLANRWRNFFGQNEDLEELTFKEWLNLYLGLKNKKYVPEYFVNRNPLALNKNILNLTSSCWSSIEEKFDLSKYEVQNCNDEEDIFSAGEVVMIIMDSFFECEDYHGFFEKIISRYGAIPIIFVDFASKMSVELALNKKTFLENIENTNSYPNLIVLSPDLVERVSIEGSPHNFSEKTYDLLAQKISNLRILKLKTQDNGKYQRKTRFIELSIKQKFVKIFICFVFSKKLIKKLRDKYKV